MISTPTRTCLAVWSENPNGLSKDLKEPLEDFIKEIFGGYTNKLLHLTNVIPFSENSLNVTNIPNGEEIKNWRDFPDNLSEGGKKRVENYVRRNITKILALVTHNGREEKAV